MSRLSRRPVVRDARVRALVRIVGGPDRRPTQSALRRVPWVTSWMTSKILGTPGTRL